MWRAKQHLDRALDLRAGLAYYRDTALRRLKRLYRTLREWFFGVKAVPPPTPKEVCLRAANDYLPKRYTGHVTVFAAREQPNNAWRDEPLMGWNGILTDVEFQTVSGGHLTMLTEPHVQALAQHLRPLLMNPAGAHPPESAAERPVRAS
jgi:hypothetical protein